MNDEIKRIDIKEFDERFYQKGELFAPSVTYILDCVYPKSYGLIDWIGDVGNKRAEEIKMESADDGSFIHECIEKLLKGFKISNDEISLKYNSHKRSLKVKRCLKAFLDWHSEYKPEVIETEHTIWNDEYLYAGTLDLKCLINGEKWIVDFKTSNSVHDNHKVQIAAYQHADGDNAKCGILHLGNTTKKRYSFLEVDHERFFDQFLIANQMFKTLYPNAKPNDEVFPEYFEIVK